MTRWKHTAVALLALSSLVSATPADAAAPATTKPKTAQKVTARKSDGTFASKAHVQGTFAMASIVSQLKNTPTKVSKFASKADLAAAKAERKSAAEAAAGEQPTAQASAKAPSKPRSSKWNITIHKAKAASAQVEAHAAEAAAPEAAHAEAAHAEAAAAAPREQHPGLELPSEAPAPAKVGWLKRNFTTSADAKATLAFAKDATKAGDLHSAASALFQREPQGFVERLRRYVAIAKVRRAATKAAGKLVQTGRLDIALNRLQLVRDIGGRTLFGRDATKKAEKLVAQKAMRLAAQAANSKTEPEAYDIAVAAANTASAIESVTFDSERAQALVTKAADRHIGTLVAGAAKLMKSNPDGAAELLARAHADLEIGFPQPAPAGVRKLNALTARLTDRVEPLYRQKKAEYEAETKAAEEQQKAMEPTAQPSAARAGQPAQHAADVHRQSQREIAAAEAAVASMAPEPWVAPAHDAPYVATHFVESAPAMHSAHVDTSYADTSMHHGY